MLSLLQGNVAQDLSDGERAEGGPEGDQVCCMWSEWQYCGTKQSIGAVVWYVAEYVT
jgi:hypothetical protein